MSEARFMAVIGSSNSGIRSKEQAIEWAQAQLNTGKHSAIYLTEVIETVERTALPIECKPFKPAPFFSSQQAAE